MTKLVTVVPVARFVWPILIGSAVGYLILGYSVPRQHFSVLISLLSLLFLGYGLLVFKYLVASQPQPINRLLFGGAIGFRVLLLLVMPCFSDDVYRFIWDGRLLQHGFNPYLYLPSQVLYSPIGTAAGLDDALFRQLNSPNYFTVYPPVNQLFFGLAAWLSGGSVFWNAVWLRVPIILSEIGSLWLLVALLRGRHQNPNLALLYGLNPLVILELTGNLHFEAVMIFFTLLAAWCLLRGQMWTSAGAMGLAIGTKLLPLVLLPLVVRWLGWKKGIGYALLTGLLVVVQFAPFASLKLAHNVFASIDLYFQKFEFNASVYYILRTIGYWIKGYNTIESVGFWLSLTTMLSILWISFRWRNVSLPTQVLAVLTLYFAFATTVHPWYTTTVVASAVFTRYRYPLLWSALIPLSYSTYQARPYHENLWLTAVEYGLVLIVWLIELVGPRLPKTARS